MSKWGASSPIRADEPARRSGLHPWKFEGRPRPPSLKLWRAAFVLAPLWLDCQPKLRRSEGWWSQPGSNRRPQACKASALPTELWPRLTMVVGREGVEPSTSRLSGVRSNHLSYRPPMPNPTGPQGPQAAGCQVGCAGPRKYACKYAGSVSRMKGHEDGGNVLWTGGSSSEDEPRRFPP